MNAPPVINRPRAITYEVSRLDLFTNYLTIFARNWIVQIAILIFLVLKGSQIFMSGISESPLILAAAITLLELAGYLVVLIVLQVIFGLATAYLMSHRGVLGKHTLEITDAGLIERTEFNEALNKWNSIGRVVSMFGYLYIYVSDFNFHQVPKRGLNAQEAADFEAELRARSGRV